MQPGPQFRAPLGALSVVGTREQPCSGETPATTQLRGAAQSSLPGELRRCFYAIRATQGATLVNDLARSVGSEEPPHLVGNRQASLLRGQRTPP